MTESVKRGSKLPDWIQEGILLDGILEEEDFKELIVPDGKLHKLLAAARVVSFHCNGKVCKQDSVLLASAFLWGFADMLDWYSKSNKFALRKAKKVSFILESLRLFFLAQIVWSKLKGTTKSFARANGMGFDEIIFVIHSIDPLWGTIDENLEKFPREITSFQEVLDVPLYARLSEGPSQDDLTEILYPGVFDAFQNPEPEPTEPVLRENLLHDEEDHVEKEETFLNYYFQEVKDQNRSYPPGHIVLESLVVTWSTIIREYFKRGISTTHFSSQEVGPEA
jgi:hypothetical protein